MDRRLFAFLVTLSLAQACLGGFARAAIPPPINLAFDPAADELCFRNADPELEQFGPLGHWGHEHGICQGIAGMAAAFFKNAVFAPTAASVTESQNDSAADGVIESQNNSADADPAEDDFPAARTSARERAARRLITRVVRLGKAGCPQRLTIPGYANLHEFCADHRREFLRSSMLYNANIALFDVFPKLFDFLARRDHPLASPHDRRQLKRVLASIYRGLASGAPQLLMHYSHVVMVYGMRYETDDAGRVRQAILHVYNSNDLQPDPSSDEWTYAFDSDGLPSLSNTSIWNVTPHRPRWLCHR